MTEPQSAQELTQQDIEQFFVLVPDQPAEPIEVPVPLKKGVPYRLSVCGEPISRPMYYSKLRTLEEFKSEHASNVRHTMDRVFRQNADSLDMVMSNITHPLLPDFMKADAAYIVLAWYTFFDPFAHPKRKFMFKKDWLVPHVELHPDSLYKYGVYVKQAPDAHIHSKLKTMHVPTAQQYFDYCAHVTVAAMEGEELSWITKW